MLYSVSLLLSMFWLIKKETLSLFLLHWFLLNYLYFLFFLYWLRYPLDLYFTNWLYWWSRFLNFANWLTLFDLRLRSRLLSFNLVEETNNSILFFLYNILRPNINQINPNFLCGIQSLVNLIHLMKNSSPIPS